MPELWTDEKSINASFVTDAVVDAAAVLWVLVELITITICGSADTIPLANSRIEQSEQRRHRYATMHSTVSAPSQANINT